MGVGIGFHSVCVECGMGGMDALSSAIDPTFALVSNVHRYTYGYVLQFALK